LVRAHPEWTAPLEKLGARDVKLAIGFPDELTIDAEALLANFRALMSLAPITRLHVRAAEGRVAEIVRSPMLEHVELLDLDSQGVTDDDLAALARSPFVERLVQLDLRYNPISAVGVEALAASTRLTRLEMVNLDGNPNDPCDRQTYFSDTDWEWVPTEAGRALEAKYGPLKWLRRT
jgi:hypothetical protein